MTIIGFNFSKLLAQQKKAAKGSLKIGTNVKLDAIERTNMAFDKDKAALRAAFTYKVTYDPDVGAIEFQGDLIFLEEAKVIESLVKEWNEKKALPKKFSTALINAIMQKCVIQALIMAKDIGLPSPMPLPKVKTQTKVKVDEEKPAAKKK